MVLNKRPVTTVRIGSATLRLEWLDDYYTDRSHMTAVWRLIVRKGNKIVFESAHHKRSTGLEHMERIGKKLLHDQVYRGRIYVEGLR